MIRLFLIIVLPLLAPYVAWYCWKVFFEKPKIDPATGEQIPPSIETAPRGKLLAAALVLLALTVGAFLLFHEKFGADPYRPLNIDEVERPQNRPAGGPEAR